MRDDVNMQEWVEGTVARTLRGAYSLKPVRGRTTRRPATATAGRGAVGGEPLKQIVVRVDGELLNRLRQVLVERGQSVSGWLVEQITSYVELHELDATCLLKPSVLNDLQEVLPRRQEPRQAVLYALLDWPQDVVAETLDDSSLGLQEAVREADTDLILRTLEVGEKKIGLRDRLERLHASKPRRGRTGDRPQ